MSTRPRRIGLALTILGLALGTLLGGVLREGGAEAARTAGATRAAEVAADRIVAGFGTGTATDLGRLEAAVRTSPRDPAVLTLLGFAYQQRWRETADASFLPRAAEALRKARAVRPNDPLVVTGLGSLALTRHEFRRALSLGRAAVRLAPGTARPYGVLGDALLELGRYEEAFRAFERMTALRPGLAAYARIAYARELLGRVDGAVQAMQLALDAASGQPEPTAWASVELAKLHFARGELRQAERYYRAALAAFPGYPYAFDGLARVEAARGRIAQAITYERRAVDTVPLPQFVGELGDLLTRAGRHEEARSQQGTVRAIDRLLAANGVRTDLEETLYDVDHRIGLGDAVARARAARSARPSIYGDDLLAWALARTGRCEEALPWSKRSLRLGTKDALLYFHRGMIERCLHRGSSATTWMRRALALNPHFSVRWSPVARRYAA
jgi:tetratricopeptide (TPR) repeat protein